NSLKWRYEWNYQKPRKRWTGNPKSQIQNRELILSILYAGKFGGKVARHKTRSKPRTEIAFESSLRHCPQKQKSAD
ncbi:hypothetical protein, partial [Thermoleptolyngbya sp.]